MTDEKYQAKRIVRDDSIGQLGENEIQEIVDYIINEQERNKMRELPSLERNQPKT